MLPYRAPHIELAPRCSQVLPEGRLLGGAVRLCLPRSRSSHGFHTALQRCRVPKKNTTGRTAVSCCDLVPCPAPLLSGIGGSTHELCRSSPQAGEVGPGRIVVCFAPPSSRMACELRLTVPFFAQNCQFFLCFGRKGATLTQKVSTLL